MKYKVLFTILFFIIILQIPSFANDEFVLIKGGEFKSGVSPNPDRPIVRVEDFEILDHTITNAEFKLFTDDTGHPVPLHWQDGVIPAGKEEYPVIYIHRMEVLDYLKWRSEKEGRIYRLPTSAEFEWASRGGLKDKKYPWGNDLSPQNANYNSDYSRHYPDWEKHLMPARSGFKNGYGLYSIVGNVWHLLDDNLDPSTIKFKYRIIDAHNLEKRIMGGSWAVGQEYLPCGKRFGLGQGVRCTDVGFRPVREPRAGDWIIVNRKLCAVQTAPNQVFISWALLEQDKPDDVFDVYRATDRSHAGFKINKKPVSTNTCFIDDNVKAGKRYQYYVRPVDSYGFANNRSEWAGITIEEKENYMPVISEFHPICKPGAIVPMFGDLNGDGTLDCVIRMGNGNHEMSQDPGVPVQLEAFTSYGRSLWRKDISDHAHCWGSANNTPVNVWDMDNDGKAEVITRLQMGDEVYLAILDGMTGDLIHRTPWPKMITDLYRSSTRVHMSIAYLDGATPSVITQTGLYENEVFNAFDNHLNPQWEYKSFGVTNGSGGHKIEVCDVDGDGKQEIFDGTTCLNPDGTLKWSIFKRHPDKVKILDFIPERPGLEVWYLVEDNINAGMYMCDAKTGEIIWKENKQEDPRWTHGHIGWAADIWDGSPGMECLGSRSGHGDLALVLFSADGRKLYDPSPVNHTYLPFEWDGDETRELLNQGGKVLSNFNGKEPVVVEGVQPNPVPNSHTFMTADLYGDFRDELVLSLSDKSGTPYVAVVTAVTPIDYKYLTATGPLDYRLWLSRNMGGGYPSVYDQPLMKPKY